MIVAFDLDDTLYPERTFVESGFRAVAEHLHRRWQLDPDEALRRMHETLSSNGRGRQFDDLVDHFELGRRQSVAELVRIYRRHEPDIEPYPEAVGALDRLRDHRLYLVTDGHRIVQANKLAALGLADRFEHAYLTHRYGIAHRKPSTYVFELICRRERCRPADIVYVGDDPTKDFVGLRPHGFRTIRVMTGRFAKTHAQPGHEAEREVATMAAVPATVGEFAAERGG